MPIDSQVWETNLDQTHHITRSYGPQPRSDRPWTRSDGTNLDQTATLPNIYHSALVTAGTDYPNKNNNKTRETSFKCFFITEGSMIDLLIIKWVNLSSVLMLKKPTYRLTF